MIAYYIAIRKGLRDSKKCQQQSSNNSRVSAAAASYQDKCVVLTCTDLLVASFGLQVGVPVAIHVSVAADTFVGRPHTTIPGGDALSGAESRPTAAQSFENQS